MLEQSHITHSPTLLFIALNISSLWLMILQLEISKKHAKTCTCNTSTEGCSNVARGTKSRPPKDHMDREYKALWNFETG